jgi:hypothetical protein
MIKQDKDVVKRVVVTPDKHFPLHDQKAINCLTKAIDIVRPDAYVDLGDVGEFDKDIKDVNKGMDMIDEALDIVSCNEKYITEGNHDNWLNLAVEAYPYIPKYKFANAMKLKERGYVYKPYGKLLKIGKLYFYHGHQYGGQYHAANHLRKMGCNIMYGHWHDLQNMTATHVDGPKAAWSIGCLKDMTPKANDWLNNRNVNWAHAFAIVDFFEKSGKFTVHVIQIIDGKTSLWGELIKG